MIDQKDIRKKIQEILFENEREAMKKIYLDYYVAARNNNPNALDEMQRSVEDLILKHREKLVDKVEK